jgi:hypothetical protein
MPYSRYVVVDDKLILVLLKGDCISKAVYITIIINKARGSHPIAM